MKTSESIELLAGALATAQSELTNPPKNKTNPHFKSSYVDLADGLDVVRKTLSKHKIAFIQGTTVSAEGVILMNTRLMHASGQWIESEYPVSGFSKPQEMGSAMTYARRYSLFAMIGVAGEDDDDGNAAQDAADSSQPATVKKSPGRPAKQMEPGLKPEDSNKALALFKAGVDMADNVDDLIRWAADNKSEIEKLIPAHRKDLLDHYKSHKEGLMNA